MFAIIFIFLLFGMSFFSILVAFLYFIVDEFLLKDKESRIYQITLRTSYIIFVIFWGYLYLNL